MAELGPQLPDVALQLLYNLHDGVVAGRWCALLRLGRLRSVGHLDGNGQAGHGVVALGRSHGAHDGVAQLERIVVLLGVLQLHQRRPAQPHRLLEHIRTLLLRQHQRHVAEDQKCPLAERAVGARLQKVDVVLKVRQRGNLRTGEALNVAQEVRALQCL